MYTCIKLTSNHQCNLGHRRDLSGNAHSDSCTPQCQAEAGLEHGTLLRSSHWTTMSGLRCNNSTLSGGACPLDSNSKDNRSTMSGGGCLSMDTEIESPKHRDSLGLHMNYYMHGTQYSQYAQSQWNTLCHMRGKQCTLKQFETMGLTRQSNEVVGNHTDPGKDILVIDKTKVFLDLWQSTRSESLRQTISCHFGGRLICELDPSPRHLM